MIFSIQLVEEVGPCICLLKMHVELLSDFNHDFIKKLQALAEKHRFLIYEDQLVFLDLKQTWSSRLGASVTRLGLISALPISL